MNIAITFRHLESTEAIKEYAQEKVGKLQKFLRSPLKATVILSVEKGQQTAELQVNAGSEHYTAREANEKLYAAIDRVCDKIEHQVNNAHGAKQAAKRGGMRAGEFARISQSDISASEIATPVAMAAAGSDEK